MKCMRLATCSCIYIKRNEQLNAVVIIYVDDFAFTGKNRGYTLVVLAEFRNYVKTDKPIENAENLLGVEIKRSNDQGIILLQMKKKIDELVHKNKFESKNQFESSSNANCLVYR
jgi:hypothetical protein